MSIVKSHGNFTVGGTHENRAGLLGTAQRRPRVRLLCISRRPGPGDPGSGGIQPGGMVELGGSPGGREGP